MAQAPRQHRLITTAHVSTETGEDWMSDQAVASRAKAGSGDTEGDTSGIYLNASRGFEVVCYWVDTDGAVVHDTGNITIRPYTEWTVGGVTFVAYAGDSRTKPPGTIMSFEDSNPRPTWIKVETATSPGGDTTHLQICIAET